LQLKTTPVAVTPAGVQVRQQQQQQQQQQHCIMCEQGRAHLFCGWDTSLLSVGERNTSQGRSKHPQQQRQHPKELYEAQLETEYRGWIQQQKRTVPILTHPSPHKLHKVKHVSNSASIHRSSSQSSIVTSEYAPVKLQFRTADTSQKLATDLYGLPDVQYMRHKLKRSTL
jgi:hypothetical protein